MRLKTRTYRGRIIRPCVSAERGEGTAHRGRWVIQGYHEHSGMPYSDDLCMHARTLAEAYEIVNHQQTARV